MAQSQRGNQTKVKKKKAVKPKASTTKKSARGRKKPSEDMRPLLLRAAIDIAGRDGWEAATHAAIAAEACCSVDDVNFFFEDIWDILFEMLDGIEDRTQSEVGDYMTDNWRDNLLEILMTRFDFAQEYRDALKALPRFAARHPLHGKRFAYRIYETMKRMLYLCRLEEERITPVAIGAFSLLYLSLVEKWAKDESPDLAPTMAAVDKRLGWFEQALGYIDYTAPACHAAHKAKGKVKKAKQKIKEAI